MIVSPHHGATSFKHNDMIDQAVIQIKDMFQQYRFSKKIPLLQIRQQIVPIIREAIEKPDVFGLFASLQAKEDYFYRHHIGVGIISSLIGKWLRLNETDLSHLMVAATLHDIGKLKIPTEIINKPGKLTHKEFEMMKKHTIWGYEMMKETVGASHRIALAALQHHERMDGSGYPFGIRSEKIDLFGRIIAVADVFHAIISDRAYSKAAFFYEALQQMDEQSFGTLDPKITRLFIEQIMQSLVGKEVILSDGSKGKVIMINSHDPLHPLVQVDGAFVDLSLISTAKIQQVLA